MVRRFGVVALLAASLVFAAPPTAGASFPGSDGKIAFQSSVDGDYEIWVINPNGARDTQLTNNSFADQSPAWSPNGGRIAFTSDRDGRLELYVMNANGRNQTCLTNTSADEYNPAWSPDGRRLVFDREIGGGDPEIVSIASDGTGKRVLTRNDDSDTGPAWSPNGERIAFTSDRNGTDHVWVMNADGRRARRITPDGITGAHDPNWSPNGRWIIFTMHDPGDPGVDYQVYKTHPDGSGLLRLTASSDNQHPAFSPDGSHFVHVDDFDTDLELVIRQKDGSNPVQITFNGVTDSQPDWQPR